MLLYRGSRQEPRRYPVPQLEETQRNPTCASCRSSIWNSTLRPALKAIPESTKRFKVTYNVSATELRRATVAGCKWCTTIANGIHGHIYLDRLYEHWNHSDSGPSSANDEIDMSDGDFDEDRAEDTLSDEATMHPPTTFDVDEEVDPFAVEYDFSVELSFERDENGYFAFINTHIRSINNPSDRPDNPATTFCDEDAVHLCYHVSICKPGLLNDLTGTSSRAEVFPADTITRSLGSETGLQRLSLWRVSIGKNASVRDVDFSHLPGRLIAIKPSHLHIINTSDLQFTGPGDIEYVALSYVWGIEQSFILLRENEHLFTTAISVNDLPRTIQDAIVVTQQLGVQYLWVDALCIMQDSDADKQRELPKMGSIYQNAALTLVAAVAKSALDGFLHVQEEHLYHIEPMYISLPAGTAANGDAVVKVSYPADYKRWKDPINSRGWTFQEFLLSSCIAFFSYRGIELIDRRTPPIENGSTSELELPLQDLPWIRPTFTLSPAFEDVRQVWLSIRGEYSQRRLGYQQDKLPAISAVAQEIGRAFKSEYLAGLWKRHLAEDLKWCHADIVYSQDPAQTNRPRRMLRSEHYIAPSWSWASIDGPIDDYTVEGGVEVKDWLGFNIIRCDVTPTIPRFEYGAVTAGELVLSGRMHSFFWRPDENPTVDCDGFLAVKTNEEPHEEWKVGEVIIDCIDLSLVDGCVVECLAVSLVERIPGREEIECLVLLPDVKGKYRRVGFGKVSATELFNDPEVFEVCIV